MLDVFAYKIAERVCGKQNRKVVIKPDGRSMLERWAVVCTVDCQVVNLMLKGLHCKKRLATFPTLAGMSLTWAGIIKLFPPRKSLVSDIPSGDGNVANLFFTVYGINKMAQS